MPKAKKNRSSSASSGCGDVQANDMRSDIAEMKTSLRFLCESFDDIKSSNHKLEKSSFRDPQAQPATERQDGRAGEREPAEGWDNRQS